MKKTIITHVAVFIFGLAYGWLLTEHKYNMRQRDLEKTNKQELKHIEQ